jgi:hypothetical protein
MVFQYLLYKGPLDAWISSLCLSQNGQETQKVGIVTISQEKVIKYQIGQLIRFC